MQYGERGARVCVRWGGKLVLGWSQHRKVTICWPLFICFSWAGGGGGTTEMQAVAPQVQQFPSSERKFCANNIKMWQFFPRRPPRKRARAVVSPNGFSFMRHV